MNSKVKKTRIRASDSRCGFVLLVTLIVLVVLAAVTTGLSMSLSMAKRRQQYMIEYQRARYGMDSAMKYILTELPRRTFPLVNRQNQPDFSDLFLMNQAEYAEFIAAWSETATDEQIEAVLREGASLSQPQPLSTQSMVSGLLALFGVGNETSDSNDLVLDSADTDEPIIAADPNELYVVELDPNDVQVPGPYGVPWPYVTEPIEFEIGPCQVTITIEDENAKMPLSWLVTSSKQTNQQAEVALETFCEWMSWDKQQLHELETAVQAAMDEIYNKKMFKLNPSPVILRTTTTRTVNTPVRSRGRVSRTRSTSRTIRQVTTKERPAVAHTTDFAKLFHSSLLDREMLARPLPDTSPRVESPLKYLSLWGAQRVNINTAPRHVLEAAFSMAMDPFDLPEFTQKVIQARQEKPFTNINDLKDMGSLDSETMDKLKNYLTTTSTFFQVRVTSQSGNARSSAVATVVKEGNKTERLVILYEQ